MMAADNHKLTDGQVNFFNLFGYLVIPKFFTQVEMNDISSEYKKIFEIFSTDVIKWTHQAHHGYKRKVLPQFIDRSEQLSALIDHPQVRGVFASLLGDNFSYRCSDANIFESSTVWHSDTCGALYKYLNVKMAVYLEELGENTGCFRVIPGSHLLGDQFAKNLQKMLGENDSLKDTLGLEDIEIPAQVLPTSPGDLLVFDFRLKHATCFKNSPSERRSFTICASERIDEQDIPKLREEIRRGAQFGYSSYYGKQMVATAGADRMPHLEQCLAQDDIFDVS